MKSKILNKRVLLLTGLFALVLVAGFLNYAITSSGWFAPGASGDGTQQVSGDLAGEDAFAVFRTERKEAREQEISYIDTVVTSDETDEATKAEAQKQKLALVANMEKELTSEGLLKTKLGMDAVVTVKTGAVSVVVKKAELSDKEVSQIVQIIQDETEEAAQNIKIMPTSA